MNFKEYFLLRENHDAIFKRFGDDPELTPIRFENNKESYSVIMFENAKGNLFFIYRKDTRGQSGHLQLRLDLMDISEFPDLADKIHGDIPVKHLPLLAARQKGIEARIWTENKIMSFSIPWNEKLVPVTERLMKMLRQDPKQYLYEMDGQTYNRNRPRNPGVMDYNAFVSGQVDNSADAQELRGLQAMAKAGFLKKDPYAQSDSYYKQGAFR